jgi:hypothetical protein
MYKSVLLRKKLMTCSLSHPKNEHQPSLNDFGHCIIKHPAGCAVTACHNQTIGRLSIEQQWWQHFYYVVQMSFNRASTECQQLLTLHLGKCMGCAATLPRNRAIRLLSR